MISKKLMLLGEYGVGKTSLVRRFVLDEFRHDYRPTMGVDIYRHTVDGLGADGRQSLELVIWDIDGNYGQGIFRHVYSRGAAGALIVGDLTRAPTIDHMLALGRGFDEALPGRFSAYVLNKADLVSGTDVALPPAMAGASPAPVRTSALTGESVAAVFRAAAQSILRRET